MTQPVSVDADEAVGLGQLLEFLVGWLNQDNDCLADSFRRFVGSDDYGIPDLRSDLARFAVLLGNGGGDLIIDDDQP